MPSFEAAQRVARATQSRIARIDLTPYKEFLQQYAVGDLVDLPLEEGETSRAIKRRLTIAAKESGMRLRYPPAETPNTVRFKIMPLEKRRIRRRTS